MDMQTQIVLEECTVYKLTRNVLFEWNGRIYRMINPDYNIEQGKCLVKAIASGWIANPDDSWQYCDYQEEEFNSWCPVRKFVYKQ